MNAITSEFDLSPLQVEIRDVARRSARERVAPQAAALDREARFPYDLVDEMAQLGFIGLTIPQSHGGTALGSLACSLVIEEVAAAGSGVAINITDQTLTASCILNFADDAIRNEWLRPLAQGEILGAFGLTEPDGGAAYACGSRRRRVGHRRRKAVHHQCRHKADQAHRSAGAHRRARRRHARSFRRCSCRWTRRASRSESPTPKWGGAAPIRARFPSTACAFRLQSHRFAR